MKGKKPDKKITKTAVALIELWQQASEAKILINTTNINMTTTTFTKEQAKDRQLVVRTDFAIVAPTLLQSASAGGQKIIIQLLSELCWNNALWYFDYSKENGRVARTISALRKESILMKTDNSSVHIVNPFLIRRGRLETVIAATTKLISESELIDESLCKNLKAPLKVDVNMYYYAIATGLFPKPY